MNSDYDKIEEKLKAEESEKKKKEMKKSGTSVFVTQEIIKKKGEDIEKGEDQKDGDDREAVAGEK